MYNSTDFQACIRNLAAYSNGDIVEKWVTFPISQQQWEQVLNDIQVGQNDEFGQPQEEFMVSDYKSAIDFNLGEYPTFEQLNEAGTVCQQAQNEGLFEALQNVLEVSDETPEEALESLEANEVTFVPGLKTDAEIGEYLIQTNYPDNNIPSDIVENNFNYGEFGRDQYNDTYTDTDEDGNQIEISAGKFWCNDDKAPDEDIGYAAVDMYGFPTDNISIYIDYEGYGRDQRLSSNVKFSSDGAVMGV